MRDINTPPLPHPLPPLPLPYPKPNLLVPCPLPKPLFPTPSPTYQPPLTNPLNPFPPPPPPPAPFTASDWVAWREGVWEEACTHALRRGDEGKRQIAQLGKRIKFLLEALDSDIVRPSQVDRRGVGCGVDGTGGWAGGVMGVVAVMSSLIIVLL